MRKYAENLVGALDRSYYNTQRDVANQAYQTNWENLQNQYKNLQEKLKVQQEQANKDFAYGLVNVSDDSFNRMQGVNQNLANRGLTISGSRDLYNQADIEQKGSDVRDLLGRSNNVAIDIGNQLSEANQKYAANQAELNKGIGDALGEIGAAETAAQMAYNKGLADIIGAAEQRKAANAAAKASGGNEYDERLKEAYIREGILVILSDPTLTNVEKEAKLKALYGIANSEDVLDAFDSTSTVEKRRQESIDRANKLYEDAKEKYSNKQKSTKKPKAYEKPKVAGQEGYEEQKKEIQTNPYGKREGLTAQGVQPGPSKGGTGYSSTGAPYSYAGNADPKEAAEVIKLYEAMLDASDVLNEAKTKNYDLYDLYEILYGNK